MQIMSILHLCMERKAKVYAIKEGYELGDNINSKVLAFGLNGRADVSAADIHTEIRDNAFCTRFTLQTADGFESCALQLAGKHNVMNALAAASAAALASQSCARIGQ